MKQPSLDELLKRVDSRYTLVVMAAKRARLLTEAGENEANGSKPVTKALEEIASGKIKFRHTKQGRK
jgi:DNA-directed RNA polymerase subunit omega (EC 2.7.7.6)